MKGIETRLDRVEGLIRRGQADDVMYSIQIFTTLGELLCQMVVRRRLVAPPSWQADMGAPE